MKTLKRILLTFALIGGMLYASAQQTVVRVYPRHGTVVTTLSSPRVRRYVVCAAPVGIRVRTLPRGNKVVLVNGRRLYKYKGIWYRKSGRNYVVVNV